MTYQQLQRERSSQGVTEEKGNWKDQNEHFRAGKHRKWL